MPFDTQADTRDRRQPALAEGVAPSMLELRLCGHADQGVMLGRGVLAAAFMRNGWFLAPTSPGRDERRDPWVTATLRVVATPVPRDADVTPSTTTLVLDLTLLPRLAVASAADGGLLLVNAPIVPCARMPGADRVVAVDAAAIAQHHGLGPLVVTAMLGAFGALTGHVDIHDLLAAVDAYVPTDAAAHVAACRDGWAVMMAKSAA